MFCVKIYVLLLEKNMTDLSETSPTEREIFESLRRQHLKEVASGDELGRARAIRTARLQASALAGSSHLLRRR